MPDPEQPTSAPVPAPPSAPESRAAAVRALDRAIEATDSPPAPAAAEPEQPAAKAKRKRPPRRHPSRSEVAARLAELRELRQAAPPAAAPAPAPRPPLLQDDTTHAAVSGAVQRISTMIFSLVAKRRGVHWRLDDDEAAALGQAFADSLRAAEQAAPGLTPWLERAALVVPIATLGAVAYEIADSRTSMEQAIASGRATRIMPGDEPPKPLTPAVTTA